MHKFTENIKSDAAMAWATLNNSANTPTYFSMANYDGYAFVVHTGTLTGAASLTLQARQRIGAAGTQANLGAAVVTTTDDGLTILEGNAPDLTVNSGYDRVGILITETATANAIVSCVLYRWKARFKQATLPS